MIQQSHRPLQFFLYMQQRLIPRKKRKIGHVAQIMRQNARNQKISLLALGGISPPRLELLRDATPGERRTLVRRLLVNLREPTTPELQSLWSFPESGHEIGGSGQCRSLPVNRGGMFLNYPRESGPCGRAARGLAIKNEGAVKGGDLCARAPGKINCSRKGGLKKERKRGLLLSGPRPKQR